MTTHFTATDAEQVPQADLAMYLAAEAPVFVSTLEDDERLEAGIIYGERLA